MWNKVLGLCCSKCLGLIFIVTRVSAAPPPPVPFSFEERVAGSRSCLHLEESVVKLTFASPRAVAGA